MQAKGCTNAIRGHYVECVDVDNFGTCQQRREQSAAWAIYGFVGDLTPEFNLKS